jgi:hypothetical protein
MPTQRRNRQRKNRRNSQRRNRKNLQRGGIRFFGIDFLESPEEKLKREAEEEVNAERKKKDAVLLANYKSTNATKGKAEKILGTDNSDTTKKEPWFKLPDWLRASSKTGKTVAAEHVQPSNTVAGHSDINFEPVNPVVVDPNKKEDEVRNSSFPGGKQKKSIKKNKKSNKKR